MGHLEELAAQLETEEKIRLLAGHDWWHTEAIDRLGVPPIHLSDGPFAVRGPRWVGATSVSFPCGTAIGATFDPLAAASLARALADECREKQVQVLLGPTVNIQRYPLGGRHFECYSEDPLLTTELAVSYIRALQMRGVAATIKHFVANDTEFERHTISSDVDDSVLSHLYLVPFERGVAEAAPWALMTSYNRVNGTYAAQHRQLIEGVLREKWGFDGLVMSDWYGAKATAESALAGLDLEMPGPPIYYGKRLARAVEAGEVSEEVLRERAFRLLQLAERVGLLNSEASQPEPVTSRAERHEISRRLAVQSFVLLENRAPTGADRPLLPLELEAGQHLAVIGPNAASTSAQGGGSAAVQPESVISVLAGLRELYEPLGVTVSHALGCRGFAETPELGGALRIQYYESGPDGSAFAGPVVYEEETAGQPLRWAGAPLEDESLLGPGTFAVRATTHLMSAASGTARLSLAQIGKARLLVDGETVIEGSKEPGERFHGVGSKEVFADFEVATGRSYEITLEYEAAPGLPIAGAFIGFVPPLPEDDQLIEEAVAKAKAADVVVCVVGTTPEWETEGEDRKGYNLPQRQDELVEAVLEANPRTVVVLNTGSPVALDWADKTAGLLQIWFGGQAVGRAVADVLSGADEPGGRLPHCVPRRLEDNPAHHYYPGSEGHMSYGEGLLVGYRHYATTKVAPRYWFGHGLSYGELSLTDLRAHLEEAHLIVSGLIENASGRRAAAVLQVYLQASEPGEGEPVLVYAGSHRLVLEAGSSAQARVETAGERLKSLGLEGFYRVMAGWSSEPDGLIECGEITLWE